MTTAATLIVVGSVAGGAQPAPSAATPGRVEWGTYGAPDEGRRWRLYVPAPRGVAKDGAPGAMRARPLLVFLHGCTQDAENLARGTRMDEAAEQAGFLVLYPEQPVTANGLRCWNWFDPAHQGRDAGEPALLAALAAEVARAHGADPARVHVAGLSAGGVMALTLGAAYPERFASVVAASAVPLGVVTSAAQAWQVMRAGASAASPDAVRALMGARARQVPLLVIHGTADPTVVPANGRQVAEQWVRAVLPAEGTVSVLRAERGTPPGDDARGTTVDRWQLENGRLLVEHVAIDGLAHAWSGGSKAGTYTDERGPSATALVAAWIARHALLADGGAR
jgi:poly(hydroxyalkanoate) depolymerase family esterase